MYQNIANKFSYDTIDKIKLKQDNEKMGGIDNTELIRNQKMGSTFEKEVAIMNKILNKYKNKNKYELVREKCINECPILFEHNTLLFNKIIKQEIDLDLLTEFINIMKEIENGICDYNSACVKISEILKCIYIDSALKKSDKLDIENPPSPKRDVSHLSYTDWKNTYSYKK